MHDVLLLKVTTYSLKYAANLKKKMLKKTEELNDLIEQKANSNKQDDIEIVEIFKQEVQDIEDERDMAIVRNTLGRYSLRGRGL